MKSLICGVFGLALFATTAVQAEANKIVTAQHSYNLTEVATGLEHPWGLDWLPDGRMVVTERPGRLRIVSSDGSVSKPLGGVPAITSDFRDGLLDVTVSPSFAADQTIFFSYSQKQGEQRWLEVASAKLVGDQLKDLKVIFASGVKVEKDQGFGSRIRFDAEGYLMISVGDHAAAANAQDTSNTLGSIIRIATDGTPAAANGGEMAPEIYAFGFKNPQGMAIHPETGAIWATDHGGKGGGEINRIERAGNYGWPTRTYSGGDAPRAVVEGNFVEPTFVWGAAPTVALSGLEIYTGPDFPAWQNDIFAGSLKKEALVRIMLNDAGTVTGIEHVIDEEIGRIREVRQGPDGRLYVLNDDPEGGIYRIDPAN